MQLVFEKRSDDGERKEPDAASPNTRLAGAFYVLTLLGGGAAVLLRGRLITPGNPASTAAAILAHGTLHGYRSRQMFWLAEQREVHWKKGIAPAIDDIPTQNDSSANPPNVARRRERSPKASSGCN